MARIMRQAAARPDEIVRLSLSCLWALCLVGLISRPTAAQEDSGPADADAAETAEPDVLSGPPIAVVNVASVERVLEDVDYLFGSVDRADMSEVVDKLLGNVGDLSGLERGKPFGAMLYLKPGLVPQPAVIGYLPVADVAALAKTVEIGPVVTKKIAEGRYEIIGRHQTLYADLIGGYAFVTNDETLLDREFPVPNEEFASLTTRYDVGVEVRPENIPPGMRDLFVNLLRTNAQAELQQRDDESDAAYAFRKSQGMDNLRMVEALLKETRSLTLGLDTSRENRKAVIELVAVAVEGTAFLESLQGLAEEPSRFAALLDDEVPLAASVNSKLDEYSRQSQTDLLKAGELEVATILTRLEQGEPPAATVEDRIAAADAKAGPAPKVEPNPADSALAARIFDPLKAVVQDGNLDAFVQFRGDPEKKFVAIGAVEIPGAAGMESAVRELIERVRTARPEAAAAFEVQYGAAEAGGVELHRLAGREIREEDKKLWGDAPALYVGFASDAIWAAVGGSRAVEVLDESITRVKEAGPVERNRAAAPFQIVITANRWVGIDPDAENLDLAREAFEEGDDTLRMDFRPTEKGGRLRIEIEEGFIRLLGLGVSKRYDESQL
ncbi:MAG: hypothetical protein WBC44_10960 [Planctomycetaceae bacterium]